MQQSQAPSVKFKPQASAILTQPCFYWTGSVPRRNGRPAPEPALHLTDVFSRAGYSPHVSVWVGNPTVLTLKNPGTECRERVDTWGRPLPHFLLMSVFLVKLWRGDLVRRKKCPTLESQVQIHGSPRSAPLGSQWRQSPVSVSEFLRSMKMSSCWVGSSSPVVYRLLTSCDRPSTGPQNTSLRKSCTACDWMSSAGPFVVRTSKVLILLEPRPSNFVNENFPVWMLAVWCCKNQRCCTGSTALQLHLFFADSSTGFPRCVCASISPT